MQGRDGVASYSWLGDQDGSSVLMRRASKAAVLVANQNPRILPTGNFIALAPGLLHRMSVDGALTPTVV